MTWLRWHLGTCADGKFQIIARNAEERPADVIAVWAILLEDAAHPDHRGLATRGIEFYATILDIPNSIINAMLEDMVSLELIRLHDDGIEIINWNKRQFQIDINDPTAWSRKQRWKAKRNAKERKGTTEARSGTGEAHPETETETETETDLEAHTAKAVRAPRRRGTRLSEKWWPSEANVEYALAHGLSLAAVNTEGERFRNYWTAKAGRGATKLDWDATWNNWILKAGETVNGRVKPKQNLAERAFELARQARELEDAANRDRRKDDTFGDD
jgi:hypothetical protein